MRETLYIEAAPHRPGSVVIDIGGEVWSNGLMMPVQAKPERPKQVKAPLSTMLNSQIQSSWILRAF